MLFPTFRFETTDTAVSRNQALSFRKMALPVPPPSRRAPWLKTRFGYIGGSEGFDLLRFEARTIALTPQNAPALLAGRQVDVLVIDSAPDDLTRNWGMSFVDWEGAGKDARDLMRQAGEAGIPRAALLRGDAGQVPLFEPLARATDRAFVTDSAARMALAELGVEAELLTPVMQPALHHGFLTKSAGPGPRVLSLDLDRAIDDPEVARILDSLTPFGLTLGSGHALIRQERVETLPPALIEANVGSITSTELRGLLAASDILVQIARPGRDPGRDVQLALNAAASRCSVVVVGHVGKDDPRRGFARILNDVTAVRAFVSRFVADPIRAHLHVRAAWRKVHHDHAASAMACALALCAPGAPDRVSRPKATVVVPSYRPRLLGRALASYRSQTWEERELIVVANTDRPEEWDRSLLDRDGAERIVFLPRRFGPGAALNIGAGRGRGDYIMRMDDDDSYGPNYVGDMMLGAAALNPDVMGLTATLYHFVDEDRYMFIARHLKPPEAYSTADIPKDGHIAGFSHTVRRDLVLRQGYPDNAHGAADVAFLIALSQRDDLLCARLDGLNAIVERRSDVLSHTWRTAQTSDNADFRDLDLLPAELLDGDPLADYPPRR